MKVMDWIEIRDSIKVGVINNLPINDWNFHGIFQYVRKNYKNEYERLIANTDLSNGFSAKEFCEKALWIVLEPKETFLITYDKALENLNEIENNLNFINLEISKLDKIKIEKKTLSVSQRYEVNKLEYFRNKNIKAKDEIVKFISYNIKEYSYNKSIKTTSSISSSTSLFTGDMPYSFSRGVIFSFRDIYNPNSLTELSNKFLDIPINEHSKLEEIYNNPRQKEIFFEFSLNYLYGKIPNHPKYNKLQDLKKMINENHIVNRRKDILNYILEAFNKGDFLVIVNILPLQIEGIFHDICQAYGIENYQLNISSINKKLELLKTKLGNFYLFEYYAFKFPIIRNQIAHGEVILDELKSKAIMLILDLIPVCEMCCEDKIPINRKISLINNKSVKALLYILKEDLLNIKIPPFYGIDESYLSQYDTDEFWDFVKDKIKSEKLYLESNKAKLSKFIEIISKLKNNNIATKRCDVFRKNLGKLLKEYNEEDKNRKEKLNKILKKFRLSNNINE